MAATMSCALAMLIAVSACVRSPPGALAAAVRAMAALRSATNSEKLRVARTSVFENVTRV